MPQDHQDCDDAALRNDLRVARRELKWVRTEQEHLTEALQRVRRHRSRLREQNGLLADAVADLLSRSYWAEVEGSRRPWRRGGTSPEADLVREVEASALFDGAWYVRRYPDTVRDRMAPALHLVRLGNRRGLDPSESFSTTRYLAKHPDTGGLPALIHHLRSGSRS